LAVDPENGPVFIKVVSNLLPYVSHSGGRNISIQGPVELQKPVFQFINFTIDDQVHTVAYNFTITIKPLPKVAVARPLIAQEKFENLTSIKPVCPIGDPKMSTLTLEQIHDLYESNSPCIALPEFKEVNELNL
jgi:hypothetical protein